MPQQHHPVAVLEIKVLNYFTKTKLSYFLLLYALSGHSSYLLLLIHYNFILFAKYTCQYTVYSQFVCDYT